MAFIEHITNYIIEHYNLSKDNLTIVFPNKRAALKLRKELERRIDYNFWIPNIVSIQQAMEEWSGLQLIESVDAIFELIKINDTFHNNAEINHSFFGLAAQMAKDFDEIDQYGINAESLFNHLTDAKKIEDWNMEIGDNVESNYIRFFSSLIQYYNALRDSLQKNGQGYYGMITRKVACYDDALLMQKTKDRKIIFAGFNALTNTEENIIVRMVESGNAVMLWDLDNYYFNDEHQEAGVFARKFFKAHPNIERQFIGDNFKNQKKNINIINVSGNSLQANALQLNLYQDIKDKKTKDYSNMVVVLADESILIPTLNSIPDPVDKIQVTMGYPYHNTITNHFIDQLFRYQKSLSTDDKKIYLWTLIKLCNSEFIKFIFDGHEYITLNKWLNERAKKSVYYFSKDEIKTLSKSIQLNDFLYTITSKWTTATDFINAVNDLLSIAILKLEKSPNNFVKNQISVANRIGNRLNMIIAKYGKYIQLEDLPVLYGQVAAQSSIKLKGDSDGLQIMGLLETRNLDFDTIHFLSVNEGTLPMAKNNSSLIPYDIRKAYNLPTYTQQQAVYAYHFYRLLQNARNINLYYNSLADGSGLGEPSRFIHQIEYEYARNNSNVVLKKIQYKSPKINQNRTSISIEKTDEMLSKIKSFSPTSIGTYIRCTLQYYFKYIEGINDDTPNEEIQMNIIGNIIHKTLENLFNKFNGSIITSELFDVINKKYFNDCYKDALATNGFNNGLPESGFNYLTKVVIDTMLSRFLKEEADFIKKGENGDDRYTLEIICTETELSHTFDIDGHEILLKGYADRIDKVNDTIRIIDYKTGSVINKNVNVTKEHTDITMMQEKAVQLLVYKYLYFKKDPTVDLSKIEPGIIALQKLNNGIFKLKTSENSDFEDDFIKAFEDYFTRFFKEVLNKDVPFSQTNDENDCSYCHFKAICKRN